MFECWGSHSCCPICGQLLHPSFSTDSVRLLTLLRVKQRFILKRTLPPGSWNHDLNCYYVENQERELEVTGFSGWVAPSYKFQNLVFVFDSKWACGRSDITMSSPCSFRWFPVSCVFKYTGNNPAIKMRPWVCVWAEVQWKRKKNMLAESQM